MTTDTNVPGKNETVEPVDAAEATELTDEQTKGALACCFVFLGLFFGAWLGMAVLGIGLIALDLWIVYKVALWTYPESWNFALWYIATIFWLNGATAIITAAINGALAAFFNVSIIGYIVAKVKKARSKKS